MISLSLLTVVSCKSAETPETQFATSVNKTAEQVKTWNEYKAVENITNAGSVRVQTTIPADEETGAPATDVDATVYMNAKDQKYAVNASAKFGESNYSAKLYYDQERLVAESEDLLGGAYGINFTDFATSLSNSIFAPGKSDYSLDEETFNIMKTLPDLFKDVSELSLKGTEAAEKVVELFMKSLVDNSTVTLTQETVSVFGKDAKAVVLAIDLTPETLASALEAFWTAVKADENVRASIEDILPLIQTLSNFTPSDDYSYDESYGSDGSDIEYPVDETSEDNFPDLSKYETVDALFADIDPMITKAATSIRELTDLAVNVKLSLNKSGLIMRADVALTLPQQTNVNIAIQLGSNFKAFEGFSVKATVSMQGISVDVVNISATIAEDTSNSYKLNLNAQFGLPSVTAAALGSENASTSITGSLTYDKKSGDAALTLNVPDEDQIVISLNYLASKGTHTIKNIQVKSGTETLPIPAITLTLKESDTMPAYNKDYKDVLTLTKEEFTTFINTVQEKIQALMGAPADTTVEG